MRRSRTVVVAFACLLVFALAGAAFAGVPGAVTGEATDVTDTGAVLEGVANPNKEATTAHFEYGTDTTFGSRTPSQAVGGGNANKAVSATLTGLAPATTYYFRLVATNASGSDYGAPKSFTTLGGTAAKPPASGVTIAAAAAKVRYGLTTVLSGKVTGSKAAGAQVTIEHSPFPFTSPFSQVGAPVKADAAGAYSATVAPAVNTRYRATAKTSPPATSEVIQVNVAPAVGLRVSDTRVRRGARVRFRGRVRPAHDGAEARIQRRTRTRGWRTVARVVLRKSVKPGQSRYSRRLRMRRTGRYRVRLPRHDDHVAGKSRKRRIVVR